MSLKKIKPGHDTIVIARHGKPALSRKVRLTSHEFKDWWGQYDLGGLAEVTKSPKKLLALANAADKVLSSSLRRAKETAFHLRGKEADEIDEVFIEAPLPPPYLGPIKLKPKAWGTLARVFWMGGLHGGMESLGAARARALTAAKKLEDEAAGGKLIVLTAHGWFNRMMATQLKKRGWKETVDQGDLHWKYRQFERKTDHQETE